MRKPKDFLIEGQQNNENDNSSMDELPECEMEQLTEAFAARVDNPELGGPLEPSCKVWVGDGWTEISSANQFLEVNGFDVNMSDVTKGILGQQWNESVYLMRLCRMRK